MARPFTPRNPRLVACPEMWHHYVFDRAINTTGLSPAGSQNCRLLHPGGTLRRAVTGGRGIPVGYVTLSVVYLGLAVAVGWILRRLSRAPMDSVSDTANATR